MISGKKVNTITINHEMLNETEVKAACEKIRKEHKIPAFDVLLDGGEKLAEHLIKVAKKMPSRQIAKG